MENPGVLNLILLSFMITLVSFSYNLARLILPKPSFQISIENFSDPQLPRNILCSSVMGFVHELNKKMHNRMLNKLYIFFVVIFLT
ncbi:MAG: hypothetical protein CM15mP65_04690 [Crocinitomicaceae bacterium]|nr:MAG: hypothetical protein CM15mP65_04690 [Crocinitomicaceae bacterium]